MLYHEDIRTRIAPLATPDSCHPSCVAYSSMRCLRTSRRRSCSSSYGFPASLRACSRSIVFFTAVYTLRVYARDFGSTRREGGQSIQATARRTSVPPARRAQERRRHRLNRTTRRRQRARRLHPRSPQPRSSPQQRRAQAYPRPARLTRSRQQRGAGSAKRRFRHHNSEPLHPPRP